jgi:hypothetical protein
MQIGRTFREWRQRFGTTVTPANTQTDTFAATAATPGSGEFVRQIVVIVP